MEIVFYRFDDSGNIVTVKQTRIKGEIPDDGAGWDYDGLRTQWKNSNQTIVSMDHLPNNVTELAIAPTLLFFWTSSCRLSITYGGTTSTPKVRDRMGSEICQLQTNLPASFPDIGEEGSEYEFIVISRDLTVFQPMLCVMLILMEDGIAYRQTLAQIREEDWIAQEERVWKLFTLG